MLAMDNRIANVSILHFTILLGHVLGDFWGAEINETCLAVFSRSLSDRAPGAERFVTVHNRKRLTGAANFPL